MHRGDRDLRPGSDLADGERVKTLLRNQLSCLGQNAVHAARFVFLPGSMATSRHDVTAASQLPGLDSIFYYS